MSDNLPISEQYRLVAKKWVDANAAADLLEDNKSSVLSEMMIALGDMPVAHAERDVKASKDWQDYIKSKVEARTKANLLKVQLEYLRMRYGEFQSYEASKRAEMRL